MEHIECFGYTAEILPACSMPTTIETSLVRVSVPKQKQSTDIWVDRFDVQLLLDDPSVLWDQPIIDAMGLEASSVGYGKLMENGAEHDEELERALDAERYHDLLPEGFIHYTPEESNTPDLFVLPGPTSKLRHAVPTAEEQSLAQERAAQRWEQGADDGDASPALLPRTSLPGHGGTPRQTCAEPQPVLPAPAPKRRKQMFKPVLAGLKAHLMADFMQEVKNRQKSTGLPVSAFWPPSLAVHLQIERTAALVNAISPMADTELRELCTTLVDEERLTLGFLNKWHSLNPYFRLIKESGYCHAHYQPDSLPAELRSMFIKEPSLEEERKRVENQ